MKVKVEFSGARDIDGMKAILDVWERCYPCGVLSGISCWGSQIDIQLTMPEATQVVPPQIVDARELAEY